MKYIYIRLLFLTLFISFIAYTGSKKGALTKEQIWKVVEKNFSKIQTCYEKSLKNNPSLTGKVILKWEIKSDGTVSNADVKSTTLKNKKAEQCMLEEVKSFNFPKPKGNGSVNVAFPFVFKPI